MVWKLSFGILRERNVQSDSSVWQFNFERQTIAVLVLRRIKTNRLTNFWKVLFSFFKFNLKFANN